MNALIVALVALAVVALIGLSLSVKVVTQYQRDVLFRLGKVVAVKEPGLTLTRLPQFVGTFRGSAERLCW